MGFTVMEIIAGDTFIVSPKWLWEDDTGEIVRSTGYNASGSRASGL